MRNRFWLTFVIVLGSLLLCGCKQTVDISFYSSGRWKLRSISTYKLGVVGRLLDQEFTKLLELPIEFDNFSGDAIELAIDELKAYYANQGIDVKSSVFTIGTRTTILFFASGHEFTTFNNILPGMIELRESQEDETTELTVDIGDWNMLLAPIWEQEVSIHTGKIIEGNSPKRWGGTATWLNPNRIELTFTPKSSYTSVLVVILVILSATVLTITLLSRRRRRSEPKGYDDFWGD